MKSRLVISFGGVADRERKHLGKKTFGVKGARAPRRRIVRATLGWLAFGPSPIGALVLGRLARGTGLGPWYPHCPLFLPGRKIILGRKRRNKFDRHIIGNSRPSMQLNFQRKFCNFFETALDAIGSFELILRFRCSYKRLVGE